MQIYNTSQSNNNSKTCKKITMSSQIEKNTQNIEKLSLAYRNIDIIDKITTKINKDVQIGKKLKLLYLSNNCISDIQNVQQFPNLQTLSLSYNQIQKIINIHYLETLPKLTHISLEGNPIYKSPVYLPCIIFVNYKHNSLKVVDKQIIEKDTKMETMKIMVDYKLRMDELIANYIKLMYLVQFSRKEALHRIIKTAAAMTNCSPRMSTVSKQYHSIRSLPNYQELFEQQNETLSQQLLDLPLTQQKSQTTPTSSLTIKMNFYLTRAEKDLQSLPNKFLMGIQDTLYLDIHKIYLNQIITHSQFQKNLYSCQTSPIAHQEQTYNLLNYQSNKKVAKSNVQIFINCMQQMLEKQRSKIEQLKQKITQKYRNSFLIFSSEKSNNQFMINYDKFSWSYPFTAQTKIQRPQKEDLIEVSEIISKVWNGKCKEMLFYEWKIVAKVFNRLRINAQMKNRLQYAATTMIRIISNTVFKKMRLSLANVVSYISTMKIVKMINTMKKKIQINISLSFNNILLYSFEQTKMLKLQEQEHQNELIVHQFKKKRQNMNVLKLCWTWWKKQIKQINLCKCNQKLLDQLENHEIQSEKLNLKIELLQKLLQITQCRLKEQESKQINPKWLLREIEKDFNEMEHKNKSPPFKTISENTKNKENFSQKKTLTLQRKFNSSSKLLKIVNQSIVQ